MHLDRQHPTPVYLQLKQVLQNQIEQGVYRSHQKLPSERDLCQTYNMSRMTARRALQELVEAGLAYTRIGKGTFVGNNTSNDPDRSLTNQIAQPFGTMNGGDSLSAWHGSRLVDQLLSFNCAGVEETIREALGSYSLETVAMILFPEVIRQLEERWLKGETSLMAHNYAITTLHSHLIGMANAVNNTESKLKALLACAPEDQHEIGLLLLTLSLRRRGFQVVYLGCNVTASDFHYVIETTRPQLVGFSASTTEAGRKLASLAQKCPELQAYQKENPTSEAVFAFGGRAFIQEPSLISQVPGLYLGDTLETAVTNVERLFLNKNIM
jgi:DNA-binding transcriptional regulator YhcF (GntR family)/methanogenic corrinoid protein MtbC1